MTLEGTSTIHCDFGHSRMSQLTFVLDGYLLGDDSIRNVGLLGNFLAKINVVNVIYSSATKFLGIMFEVFIVNCASAESNAIVEERETQCPRPFKMFISFEQPVICLTAITNANDFGVWIFPLLEILIRSWQTENTLATCFLSTSTYSQACASSENPRSQEKKIEHKWRN